jgi:ribosomal protein S18 acetylase RimI-like enzyme
MVTRRSTDDDPFPTTPAIPVVRVAEVTDRADVVATTVAAFEHDPAFRYFFPDDERYHAQATAFAEFLFDKRVGHGTVWVTDGCEAASLWSPPTNRTNDADAARVADLHRAMIRRIGNDAAAWLDAYERAVAAELPADAGYWYLGILACHPAHGGRGFGSAVMRAGVQLVRASNGVAYLETTNPANVAYYESAGWRLTATIETTTPSTIFVLRIA